jgi:hypothetical protein
MKEAQELALQFGFDLDELKLRDEKLKAPREVDRRICLCGHAVSRHSMEENVFCIPARWQCHCRRLKPVMVVEDTRVFVRKSYGYGPDHALLRSLPELAKRGKKGQWLDGLSCVVTGCDAEGVLLTPAMLELDPNGRRYDLLRDERDVAPSIYLRKITDALLCPAHLETAREEGLYHNPPSYPAPSLASAQGHSGAPSDPFRSSDGEP